MNIEIEIDRLTKMQFVYNFQRVQAQNQQKQLNITTQQ